MTEKKPIKHFKYGKSLLNDDNGVLLFLNEDMAWEFSGSLVGLFMGDAAGDDPEFIPDLNTFKTLYRKIPGGKAWVP